MKLARGQGTVEVAIGATVWVTIVVLGLWLSEVSFLQVKVQEASAAAVWEAAGRKVDDYSVADNAQGDTDYQDALDGVGRAVSNRYADFDGLESAGRQTRRLLVEGRVTSVSCVPGAGQTPLSYDVPAATRYSDRTGAVPTAVNDALRTLYRPRVATMCSASAVAAPYQLPEHFDDQGGQAWFNTPLRKDGSIQLCGVGRAKNGACQGRYAVLLGDWALDGLPTSDATKNLMLAKEHDQEHQTGNLPYKAMVQHLYEVSGTGYGANQHNYQASARFLSKIANQFPLINETDFAMSYSGVEGGYGDLLKFSAPIPPNCKGCHFNTTGTSPVNGNPTPTHDWNSLRAQCFLGLGGCARPPH
jgi:hypothetical protein